MESFHLWFWSSKTHYILWKYPLFYILGVRDPFRLFNFYRVITNVRTGQVYSHMILSCFIIKRVHSYASYGEFAILYGVS